MTDSTLRKDIEAFVEANRENIVRDITRLVAVDSVNGPAEEGKPFGAGPAKALETALGIAEEMGLGTRNCEGYMGYATVGEGEDYLATIAHLDVVPPGEGWKADPFTVREREGWLLGRGVMDNKGPAVLTLYMLKYLKEKNIPLKHEIRALLGVNEEIGMGDVDLYLANYPAPKFCFTPDAAFPVCNGEKGIYHGRLISRQPKGNVVDIKGGLAGNAVPGKAEAWVRFEGELEGTEAVEAAKEEGLWHLTAHGKGGHASNPKGTINAISVLIDFIMDKGLADANEAKFFALLQKLHSAFDGSGLGVDADDGQLGPLTIIGGVIGFNEEGRMFQILDSRYPTNTSGDDIVAKIAAVAGDVAEVTKDQDAVPFYISADRPEIRCCIDTFNEFTGKDLKPFTMGGGTYARHFPNAVSFGTENFMLKTPEWIGPVHGAEEGGNVDWLMTALQIFIAAMMRLDEEL